jgi:hypothetical protein
MYFTQLFELATTQQLMEIFEVSHTEISVCLEGLLPPESYQEILREASDREKILFCFGKNNNTVNTLDAAQVMGILLHEEFDNEDRNSLFSLKKDKGQIWIVREDKMVQTIRRTQAIETLA